MSAIHSRSHRLAKLMGGQADLTDCANPGKACWGDDCWDYCKEEPYICGTTYFGDEVWTLPEYSKDPAGSGMDSEW